MVGNADDEFSYAETHKCQLDECILIFLYKIPISDMVRLPSFQGWKYIFILL